MKSFIGLLVGLGLCSGWALAQTNSTPPPASQPIVDHCRGPIDPYDTGQEKLRFFSAAGVDNELTRKEAGENKTAKEPFVRSFETFHAMLAFDRDKNGTIDWLEADTYRRDLQKRVLAAFDVNKDKRLTGEERVKANATLATGTWPGAKSKSGRGLMGMLSDSVNVDQEMVQRFDANGDGVLSEDEIQAGMKQMQEEERQRMIERYDTDNDGKLSDEERKAMREDRRSKFQKRLDQWQLRNFDENDNGILDDDERQAAKKWQDDIGTAMKELNLNVRMNDIDGDGKVSKDEQNVVRKEWMVVGMRMMLLQRGLADRDQDGTVSAQEQLQFQDKIGEGMMGWMEQFSEQFDDDQNDRLDTTERAAVIKGLKTEIDRRLTKHDANKDGRTDAYEMEKLIWEFGRETGVIPKRETASSTTRPVKK